MQYHFSWREGGRERGREGGREGERERERGRDGEREGGREKEGGREREGRREGGRERGRDGGGREREKGWIEQLCIYRDFKRTLPTSEAGDRHSLHRDIEYFAEVVMGEVSLTHPPEDSQLLALSRAL